LMPDLTILIDIALETSLARARARGLSETETRMDGQAAEFHERVRQAYLAIAAREPGRFRVIDGRGSIEETAEAIWQAVCPHV
jgi:dTMP kinase